MNGGAWWATVHGVAKSQTRLSDFTFNFHFHALEKEMATHSSVLAWRIPGTGEPGGLLSMGSHRVGHDWSDLAVAAKWVSFETRIQQVNVIAEPEKYILHKRDVRYQSPFNFRRRSVIWWKMTSSLGSFQFSMKLHVYFLAMGENIYKIGKMVWID